MLGSLLGVGVVTEDLATRRALADLPSPDRLVGVVRSVPGGFDAEESEGVARAALEPVLEVTEPVLAATLFQPAAEPFRILALDDPASWAEVADGRPPAPCAATGPCEAVRIGSNALPSGVGEIGTSVELAGRRFEIVGVARPVPDFPLAVINPDGLALLVGGRASIRGAEDLIDVPRTEYWLAPIDPEDVHSWTLADLGSRIDAVERSLAPAGRTYRLATPEQTLATVAQRTQVATGRLVFVSSLIVGVLLAFAAFAAAIERNDVALEDRRLRAAGASRATRLLFLLGEAVVPAAAGALIGVAGAALAVGLLAGAVGAPIDVVLGVALARPLAVTLIALLVGLALVAIVLGIHPAAGRLLQPRVVLAAVVPVGVLLLWDRLSSGPADPAALAASATSPATVLLPGALGLAVILGSLAVLPPVLRALARAARRAPLPVRLATISVAREPLRPAAVMTLLAFSVGAVVFALAYVATLGRGAADQAAFLAGMDVRVQSLAAEERFATEVVPSLRSGALGPDVDVFPMVRLSGESSTRRTFTLVGIDGPALAELRGWRADFSPSSPAALGSAIELGPGDWSLASQPLPDGAREVSIGVEVLDGGDPVHLLAVVREANGRVRYVELGDIAPGAQTMRGNLFTLRELDVLEPGEPRGWSVLGLVAGNGGPAAGGGPEQGHRQQADVRITGLEALFDPTTTVHLDVSGVRSAQFIRPPVLTDGLVLPAIVSPDLAADVDAGGELVVRIGSSLDLTVRPVGVATRFPTILDADRVVVVDLEPLLLALDAHDPGTGAPNQVLLRTPSDARTAEAVAALGQPPFPRLVVQSRPAIEAARSSDPFTIGLVWALAVGAIAGLVLSIAGVLLSTAAELRDERGELWDLEAQGTTPRSLATLILLRTVAMGAVGSVTGIAVGVGLGWFVAASVGVGGEGGAPIPSLVLVTPWALVLPIAVALVLVIAVVVAGLTGRHFRRASVGTVGR